MIANKLCITSVQTILVACFCVIITTRNGLINAQYHGSSYHGMSNQYGGGGGGYGDYYNGYGGGSVKSSSGIGSGEEMDDRPKVQLGIRLKIPAFKFELPRVNLPKITVSAKIRQPDGPRVIRLPEFNLDTSSKVSPPGALGVDSGDANGQHTPEQSSYYGHGQQKQSHYNNENVQTFSFSTQSGSDEIPQPPTRYRYPSPVNYANQYRSQPQFRAQDYSSSNYRPSYMVSGQNQYTKMQNSNMNNNKGNMITNYEGHKMMVNDPDIGFNSPVYMEPGQTQASNLINTHVKPTIHYRANNHHQKRFISSTFV